MLFQQFPNAATTFLLPQDDISFKNLSEFNNKKWVGNPEMKCLIWAKQISSFFFFSWCISASNVSQSHCSPYDYIFQKKQFCFQTLIFEVCFPARSLTALSTLCFCKGLQIRKRSHPKIRNKQLVAICMRLGLNDMASDRQELGATLGQKAVNCEPVHLPRL